MHIKIPTHTYVCTGIAIHPSYHFVLHTRTPRLGSLDHDMSLSCHEAAELQHRCTDPSYVRISLGFQFRVSCDYLVFVGGGVSEEEGGILMRVCTGLFAQPFSSLS